MRHYLVCPNGVGSIAAHAARPPARAAAVGDPLPSLLLVGAPLPESHVLLMCLRKYVLYPRPSALGQSTGLRHAGPSFGIGPVSEEDAAAALCGVCVAAGDVVGATRLVAAASFTGHAKEQVSVAVGVRWTRKPPPPGVSCGAAAAGRHTVAGTEGRGRGGARGDTRAGDAQRCRRVARVAGCEVVHERASRRPGRHSHAPASCCASWARRLIVPCSRPKSRTS